MIINPFVFAAAGGGASITWNPADKGSNVVLSSSDTVATGNGTGNCIVRATTSYTTSGAAAKKYFELVHNDVSSPIGGICTAGIAYSSTLGYGASGVFDSLNNAFKYHNGAYSSTGITIVGARVNIAVDFAAAKIWFGRNGVWILSGDPVAGTNPSATLNASTAYFPCGRVVGVGTVCTAHFATASFVDTPPSGYSQW